MVIRKARIAQRMLIALRMNSNEEEKVFCAKRKELQSMHREVGQRSMEDTNDTEKGEFSKMTNMERVDKEGNIYVTFNGATYY